jgi:hypothetical protein
MDRPNFTDLTNMESSDEDDVTILSHEVPNNSDVTEITSTEFYKGVQDKLERSKVNSPQKWRNLRSKKGSRLL